MTADTQARTDRWLLVLVGALFAANLLRHATFVPVWDSAQYVDCLLDAVNSGSPRALNCFKHPTAAYMAVLALPQFVFKGSVVALHVTNVLLGLVALAAFHSIARRLAPARFDALLATACFAFLPMFGAQLLDPTPDFGVLVFLLLFVALLAADRIVPATLVGVALVLSKESGMLLYGVTIVSFAIAWAPGNPGLATLRARLPRLALLVLPVLAAAAFVFGGPKEPGAGGGLWNGLTPAQALAMMLRLDFDKHSGSQAAALFVMSFSWLPTSFVALWLATSPTRRPLRLDDDRRLLLALGLILGLGLFVLTRFPTFSHPRYILGLFPFLLLLFARALSSLVRHERLRRLVAACVLVLFALSNARTLDPVSRELWGTWTFGERELLRVTGITGECCGHGLDGLVYNQQFTALGALFDATLERLAPAPDDLFLVPRDTNWQILNHVDRASHHRTLRAEGSFHPRVHSVELGPPPPARRYLFLAIPTADPLPALGLASRALQLESNAFVEYDGYRLDFGVFVPRPPPAPRPGDSAPRP